MGDKHITVENIEGDSKARWHTTETYKVSDAAAKELSGLKEQPKGRDLVSWLQDHGGVLDDGNGHAARESKRNDGTLLNDHYVAGEFKNSDVVRPKGAKNDDNTNAQTLLAILTGGTSLFITPFIDHDQPETGSKFGSTTPTTQPTEHQPAAAKDTKPAATATAPAPPKR